MILPKLSLWLATLARDHEFTFLDHSLRQGDSLLGVTARQIAAFDWEPNPSLSFLEGDLRRRIARAAKARKEILDSREGTPYAQLAQQLAVAEDQLGLVRNVGDVLVGAFFAGQTRAARRTAKTLRQGKVQIAFGNPPDFAAGVELSKIAEKERKFVKPLVAFHWELEFPEVFNLDSALLPERGFDVIVGNPPFAGRNTIIEGSADGYIDWLKELHPESHGNADLVAHFFRRSFTLLRRGGTFGLIATNTIAQGDTRFSGLRWICRHEGVIFRAEKRLPWPGEAAVVVSVVHVCKGPTAGPYVLNNKPVDEITAFLFYAYGHENPKRMSANHDKAFEGVKITGSGFTFDDVGRGQNRGASPLTDMERLLGINPRNKERIFPYLGGDEVNKEPGHSHHRWVINFEDFPLRREDTGESWFAVSDSSRRQQLQRGIVSYDYPTPVAADWPELLAHVAQRVRDVRTNNRLSVWWRFERARPNLTRALKQVNQVFVINTGASPHLALARVESKTVFAHSLVIFPTERFSVFSAIQARPHEVWARFMASSLEDRLRYTPTDCFETFPFPPHYESSEELDQAGKAYYEFRAALMVRNNEGLTKTYNRFHRPDECSADIAKLRHLHDQMDRAVLDAYGWHDLQPVPTFFLEFEEEDEEEDRAPGRVKAKKYRYKWPDEIHDEVLARLLALNLERTALQHLPETTASRKPKRAKVNKRSGTKEEPVLF